MFQQLYLPCAKIQESPLLSCCTYCIKSSHLNNHQIRWPYARGCFPKIKGKAWFRQHLPEDGKTAVELGGCNLHVLGRFDAVKLYEIVMYRIVQLKYVKIVVQSCPFFRYNG